MNECEEWLKECLLVFPEIKRKKINIDYKRIVSKKLGYVSAKIDSGNSGGIAFSKDSRGLCVLGIPTWLTVGNYETQGLIQNIHNAFYSK